MNIEQTSENIFTYTKTHYGGTIPAKIQKLEKNMIKYSSYTNIYNFPFIVITTRFYQKTYY